MCYYIIIDEPEEPNVHCEFAYHHWRWRHCS